MQQAFIMCYLCLIVQLIHLHTRKGCILFIVCMCWFVCVYVCGEWQLGQWELIICSFSGTAVVVVHVEEYNLLQRAEQCQNWPGLEMSLYAYLNFHLFLEAYFARAGRIPDQC